MFALMTLARHYRSLSLVALGLASAFFACAEDSATPAVPGFDSGAGFDAAAGVDATTNADGGAGAAIDANVTDVSPPPDAGRADAAAPDADATTEDADAACPVDTILGCDLDSGLETRCSADGGAVQVLCALGCHPAGQCVQSLAVDAGPDLVLAIDASATLGAAVTGGVGPFLFQWSPTTGLDDASSPAPVVTVGSTTPYVVSVTDTRALSASDTVLVKVPDAPLALARWTVVNYAYPGGQGAANWTFQDGGVIAVQSVNGDPSLLVSDFALSAFEVTGRFAITNAGGDNDFVGFAFGYQDSGHYYLLDWKGAAQALAGCGTAARGLTLRKIDSDTEPTCLTMWGTTGADAGATVLSPASLNDVPWVAGTYYDFKLSHSAAGVIAIEIRNSTTQAVVGSLSVTDTTWLSGRFAFYNYSQANARYELFRARDLP